MAHAEDLVRAYVAAGLGIGAIDVAVSATLALPEDRPAAVRCSAWTVLRTLSWACPSASAQSSTTSSRAIVPRWSRPPRRSRWTSLGRAGSCPATARARGTVAGLACALSTRRSGWILQALDRRLEGSTPQKLHPDLWVMRAPGIPDLSLLLK